MPRDEDVVEFFHFQNAHNLINHKVVEQAVLML